MAWIIDNVPNHERNEPIPLSLQCSHAEIYARVKLGKVFRLPLGPRAGGPQIDKMAAIAASLRPKRRHRGQRKGERVVHVRYVWGSTGVEPDSYPVWFKYCLLLLCVLYCLTNKAFYLPYYADSVSFLIYNLPFFYT